MTTSGPEPTEERRPTSDSWRDLANDATEEMLSLTWDEDANALRAYSLRERRDALLAAEPEHLPVFHVVEGMDYKLVSGEHITHWHVRVVARNGLTFQTDSVSEKRLALEAAEWLAALTGGTVVEG